MSVFDEIDAATHAASEELFGDQVRIRPQSGDPNYGAGADGSRAIAEIVAVYSPASKARALDYPNTSMPSVPSQIMPAELWISAAALASIGYALKRGDKIEILSGAYADQRHAISSISLDESGAVTITLA